MAEPALPAYERLTGDANGKLRSPGEKPSAYAWSLGSSGSTTPDPERTGTVSVTPRSQWLRVGTAAVVGLIAGAFLARSYSSRSGASIGPTRRDVWQQYDIKENTLVGTKHRVVDDRPKCERTLVLEWETWQYGFGSTTISTLQAMLFAKEYGYEVLFSSEKNPYGAYLDFFEPHAPAHCRITPEMYQLDGTTELHKVTAEARRASDSAPNPSDTPRIRSSSGDTHPLNRYVRDTTFDMKALDSLPPLDSSRPMLGPDNVPALFRKRFLQYSALTAAHFQLNTKIRSRRDRLRYDLGVLERSEQPTIGMHYRGGDKLMHECRPSSRMSCGNITLHCETALDALRSFAFDYPHFKLGESKARLLLMTAEPDALSRLEAEPICMRHFEIVPFPRGGTDKPYKQSEFAELPLDARIDDTERFLAEADILANYVDAAVVSANSNTGRLIFTRAGPARAIDEYRVRSVDLPWHPMQFPTFAGLCDGTTGHCFPS
ncbi:hypothetical protein JCM8202_003789 [Rhodotorula sphaerocarpa]